MIIDRMVRGVAAISLLALWGCNSLDVANTNDATRKLALVDPTAVEALAGGTMQTWFNAYTGLRSAGVLSAQARTYSSSWNNGNLNFYSGVDVGPSDTITSAATWTRDSRSWQNDPSASARTSIDAFWGGGLDESAIVRPGFYTVLSGAADALYAIRTSGVVIKNAATTKRAETIAVFMQGAALMGLSLNYDKAYFVDEKSDLSPAGVVALVYLDRKKLRDSAIVKLAAAATLAGANVFTTDPSWADGIAYTNVQIQQVANTMAAMTLAWYPRDDTENAAVNWASVAALASAGTSSGTPVDFNFIGDGYNNWISELMYWFNGNDTGRLSTRVAHFLDPATQTDPYPLGVGTVQPNSLDRRMGDGSFGTAAMVGGFDNIPKTANGGTDFMYSRTGEVFRPDRGYYHQSNIGQIRYDVSGVQDPSDVYGGFGIMPTVNAIQNDLIWAEALLRLGGAGNLASAVTLINKTRQGRGNLAAAAVGDGAGTDADGPCMSNGKLAKNGGACTVFSKLLYEYEVELLGLGPAPFYNQRHLPVLLATKWEAVNATTIFNSARYIQGLLPGTPREMPVPYKELGVKAEALYTYGGATPKGAVP